MQDFKRFLCSQEYIEIEPQKRSEICRFINSENDVISIWQRQRISKTNLGLNEKDWHLFKLYKSIYATNQHHLQRLSTKDFAYFICNNNFAKGDYEICIEWLGKRYRAN